MIVLKILQSLLAVVATGLGFYCALGIYTNRLDARSKKSKNCFIIAVSCLIVSFILLLITKG